MIARVPAQETRTQLLESAIANAELRLLGTGIQRLAVFQKAAIA